MFYEDTHCRGYDAILSLLCVRQKRAVSRHRLNAQQDISVCPEAIQLNQTLRLSIMDFRRDKMRVLRTDERLRWAMVPSAVPQTSCSDEPTHMTDRTALLPGKNVRKRVRHNLPYTNPSVQSARSQELPGWTIRDYRDGVRVAFKMLHTGGLLISQRHRGKECSQEPGGPGERCSRMPIGTRHPPWGFA